MKQIILQDFDEHDKIVEQEVLLGDYMRVHIGEDGSVDFSMTTSFGTKTEISFDSEGALESLNIDQR